MRYITASELGRFTFCRRQWHLSKKDAPRVEQLAPTDPREIGRLAHERHAEKVEQATRQTERLNFIITIAALILLAVIAGAIFGRLV